VIPTLLVHVRRNLFRGLLLILPLAITAWVIQLLFGLVSRHATPRLQRMVEWAGIEAPDGAIGAVSFSVASVLITAILIYTIGVIGSNFTGRRWVRWFESWILRVPLVRNVYGPLRQLLDSFGSDRHENFSSVVLIQYPRTGLWTMGFVTTEKRHSFGGEKPKIPVFLPTTPNPTSRWLVFVEEDDLLTLDLTVEESIKLIVSGGIVGPDDLGQLTR
jgi:uncharacterized membrane protein